VEVRVTCSAARDDGCRHQYVKWHSPIRAPPKPTAAQLLIISTGARERRWDSADVSLFRTHPNRAIVAAMQVFPLAIHRILCEIPSPTASIEVYIRRRTISQALDEASRLPSAYLFSRPPSVNRSCGPGIPCFSHHQCCFAKQSSPRTGRIGVSSQRRLLVRSLWAWKESWIGPREDVPPQQDAKTDRIAAIVASAFGLDCVVDIWCISIMAAATPISTHWQKKLFSWLVSHFAHPPNRLSLTARALQPLFFPSRFNQS